MTAGRGRHRGRIGALLPLLLLVIAGRCSAQGVGNELCPEARCDTQSAIETLWGVPDPSFFLQCRLVPDGSWQLELMPCAPGTWFHFRLQVCVVSDVWEGCDGTEGPTTTPSGPGTGEPGTELDPCPGPRCVTSAEINTLWVHPSPGHFYQCRPGTAGWFPQEMPCAPGTLFSFRHQVCVHPWDWVEPCPGGVTTVTPGPPITTTVGPPPSTVSPPPTPPIVVDCLVPNCALLQDEVIRFPTREGPQYFYRCELLLNSFWVPRLDLCPGGLYFYFGVQDCVQPVDWIDLCAGVPDDFTTTQLTTVEPPPTEVPPPMPLPVICGSPRCSTPAERSILWPSTVADMFYRCVWNELLFQFVPRAERCQNFLFFDFLAQECVFPLDWVDICPMYPTLPPPPAPPCAECCPTCPEAPVDPSLPLPIICGQPRCVLDEERAFLWPALEPTEYYACVVIGEGWVQATLQQCAAGLLFNTLDQRCVTPDLYDASFCPVFPPIDSTTPTPAPTPTPTVCLEAYDPSPLFPIICDVPRCGTAAEQATRWPAWDSGSYFVCDGPGAVLTRCPVGETFHFLAQCCRAGPPATVQVCPVYPPIVTSPPIPPLPMCLPDFDPVPLIPLQCDAPRCGTPTERTTLWPSSDPQIYYLCYEQLPELYEPVLQTCLGTTNFDFLQQCCSADQPAVDACTLFVEPIPDEATLPLPIECDRPRCVTERERQFLWPATDRQLLYACEPPANGVGAVYEPRTYTCGPGQAFHVWKQDCVALPTAIPVVNLCPVFHGLRNGTAPWQPTSGPVLTPPAIG
ncbi:uncharacterized protein LOC128277737 [Anopheles cruzii]|uniref:uncharacterized protein LOC128277737 n=1 Tax=Anopheles cruzii TaxID=68878 RepID=UPI0022EC27C0|nr:uncharacterized protein LOC128277737 [Anopheles cruzii]